MNKRFLILTLLTLIAVLAVPLAVAAGAGTFSPSKYARIGIPPSPFETPNQEQGLRKLSIEGWLSNRFNLSYQDATPVAWRTLIRLHPLAPAGSEGGWSRPLKFA